MVGASDSSWRRWARRAGLRLSVPWQSRAEQVAAQAMLDGLTGVVIDGRQPGNRKGVAVDPHWVALRVSVDDLKTLVFYSPRDRPQFLQRHLDDIVRVEVLNASSPMVLDVAIDRTKIAIVTIRPRLAFSYGNPVEASIQLEYFGVEQ